MSANSGRMGRGAIARLQAAGLVSSSQSESVSVAAQELERTRLLSERQALQRAITPEREVDDRRNKTASLEQCTLDGKTVSAGSSDADARVDDVEREIDELSDADTLSEPSVLDVKTTVTTCNDAQTRIDAAREIDTLRDTTLQSDQHVRTASARSDKAEATGDAAEREVEYLRYKNADLENRIHDAETTITESRDAHARAEGAERRCEELEVQLMKVLARGNALPSQS